MHRTRLKPMIKISNNNIIMMMIIIIVVRIIAFECFQLAHLLFMQMPKFARYARCLSHENVLDGSREISGLKG